VSNKVIEKFFKSENMTFAVIGLLTQKLTYDGILQLIKLFGKIVPFLISLKSEQFVLIPVVSS
jgi:hypothetical protein